MLIYPAGCLGRSLGKILLDYGIAIHCYVDKNADKIKDIPVITPQQLNKVSDNTIVFVSTNSSIMNKQLSNTVKKYNDKLVILNGFHLNRLLKQPICSKKDTPIDIIECENCGFERHNCDICLNYLKINAVEKDYGSESFTWFGYIVGQACTLKCIHCCEGIPFQKEHKFVPKDIIVKDIKKMAEASKFLTFVELIGGEPFLHPQYKELIEELLQIKNIGYIKSFTNGTVVPSIELCQVLKNPRFMLQVSNYEKQTSGKLLENIFKTKKILKDQGINYIFTQNFEWQDFSSFDFHSVDKDKFKSCPLHNCNRLYKGTMYRCPHQYAGITTGKLHRKAYEFIDINYCNSKELAIALEKFEHLNYIHACNYCSMPFDAPTVPAGIQSSKKGHS